TIALCVYASAHLAVHPDALSSDRLAGTGAAAEGLRARYGWMIRGGHVPVSISQQRQQAGEAGESGQHDQRREQAYRDRRRFRIGHGSAQPEHYAATAKFGYTQT